MSEPYLGELRLMSFVFAPKGWALCNGQLLPINTNQPLFSLLGTMYGGDGRVNFALPDLRNRVPVHRGDEIGQGTKTGADQHTLSMNELPMHTHALRGTTATGDRPTPGLLAGANNVYAPPDDGLTTLAPQTIASVGGGQAHDNRQPTLALSWCIAHQGIFPSQT
jgi:microcystin-dependent protein